MTATHIIDGLLAFFTLLLVGFVLTIVRAPAWTGTASGESEQLAQPEYPLPAPEPVRPDHPPRHAPGHAPAFTPEAGSPMPPVYRAYTPRHLPVQPPSDGGGRPKVSGTPPWGPAPRPPGY
jgi:hypothetical protein